MKKKYLIMDKTTNTGAEYIGEMGQNCRYADQAMIFESEQEADNYIEFMTWQNWAVVREA